MEQARYEVVTRALTHFPSRRVVLRGIAGAGLGFGALKATDIVDARKKKRKGKKPKRPAFNQYGCLNVGQACRGNSALCCSGICEGKAPRKGKRDRSRCVSHHLGTCTPQTNSCQTGIDVRCAEGNVLSACTRTTGNAAFCADISNGTTSHCRVCSKDADCQGEFGPTAACVVLDGGCTPLCPATGSTACLPAAV
jgi:hypothetical protein